MKFFRVRPCHIHLCFPSTKWGPGRRLAICEYLLNEKKVRERGKEEGRVREEGRDGRRKGGYDQGNGDYRARSSPGPLMLAHKRPKVCLWESLVLKCLLIDKMSPTVLQHAQDGFT